MKLFNLFSKETINFQDNLHHSQFKGYFKKRLQAYEEIKNYEKINSYKSLLDYLYQKYPIGMIPHYDYPFLFHFRHIFEKLNNPLIVNDFGGNFGAHFNAVSNFLPGTTSEWNIYEEESIIDDLEELNSPPTFSPGINFYKSNDTFRNCNVVYASGSIQYYDIETPVELLTQIPDKPQFVIFNQIPLDNNIECNFYTLQNIFKQIVVNTVFSEKYFINEMNAFGYTLKDQWKDYSANCNILNHEYNLPFYSGQFYQLIN